MDLPTFDCRNHELTEMKRMLHHFVSTLRIVNTHSP